MSRHVGPEDDLASSVQKMWRRWLQFLVVLEGTDGNVSGMRFGIRSRNIPKNHRSL